MVSDRQQCADQILEAIEYGQLSKEEMERRLNQIINDELSGPVDANHDAGKVELCNSLLWQLQTHGRIELQSPSEHIKQKIARAHTIHKRRKTIAKRSIYAATAVLLLFVGLTATSVISPVQWFTGRSSVDEQQYIVEGHEISIDVIASAIAEHHGEGELLTDNAEDLTSFIGFDLNFPPSFDNKYFASIYFAMFADDYIRSYCDYFLADDKTDSCSMTLWITLYSDPELVYIEYEQDEAGNEISIQGKQVYQYKNASRTNYLWTEGNALYRLTFHNPLPNEEDYVQRVIKRSENR